MIDELGRLGDRGITTSCHSCFLSCDCSQLAIYIASPRSFVLIASILPTLIIAKGLGQG